MGSKQSRPRQLALPREGEENQTESRHPTSLEKRWIWLAERLAGADHFRLLKQVIRQKRRLRYRDQDPAIYCKCCELWLSGPTQWTDHEIGKKHPKKNRKWVKAVRAT